MRILQEDSNQLLFEEYPAPPSRLIFVYSFFIILLTFIENKENLFLGLLYSCVVAFLVYAIFLFYFHYKNSHPLTVSLNQQENLLTISGYSLWPQAPVVLPLDSIAKIEFSPLVMGSYTFYKSCRVTLAFKENITFTLTGNIFYFEAYERMAKKIAEFSHVEFVNKVL